jgi:hypothetical protein
MKTPHPKTFFTTNWLVESKRGPRRLCNSFPIKGTDIETLRRRWKAAFGPITSSKSRIVLLSFDLDAIHHNHITQQKPLC